LAVLKFHEITEQYVVLKFDFPVDTSTLINNNFVLTKIDATPSQTLTSPFDPIVVSRDYHPVSRELFLHWNLTLETDSDYRITLQNIKNAFDVIVPTHHIYFSTTDLNLATPNVSEPNFTKDPTNIEDFSIKVVSDLFLDVTDIGGSGVSEPSNAFNIVSIHPDVTEAFYIGPYDFNGKIEITFSHYIPANFLNNQDFKLQKKSILTRGISTWQTINTLVTQSSNDPIVSIYIPSQGIVPIYAYEATELADHIFWEEGYKYRLIISKNVGY